MILVTGGTGLLGAHLLLHLVENGAEVRAIYRKINSIEKTKKLFDHYQKAPLFDKIEWIQANIIDVCSLEPIFHNITMVYHCAALISFDPKDEKSIRKTNIEGTANIVNMCLAYHIKKLCHVSSIAALGDLTDNGNVITEKTEWNPEKSHSDYAISKYGAEMEIWRGQQEGLDTIIVNPGLVIGPKIWKTGNNTFLQKIDKGFSFYTKGSTGLVAITDVVHIMEKLMNSTIKNEQFIVVSTNIKYRKLFDKIATYTGTKKPQWYINPTFTGLLWRLDWFLATFFGKKRKINKWTASILCTENHFSNKKLIETIDYDFIDIEQYLKSILVRTK